jgi:hypothetical protein
MHLQPQIRGTDTTWRIYNSIRLIRLDWTCVRAVATRSNSNYIRYVVKSIATNCIKVVTIKTNLDHIKYEVTTTTTSGNKVAIMRTKSNPLINNYIVVNIGIIKATTNFVYNRKFDNASIWNTSKTYCKIDRANCGILDRSYFWIIGLETTKHFFNNYSKKKDDPKF